MESNPVSRARCMMYTTLSGSPMTWHSALHTPAFVGLEYNLVLLGLHCFLRLAHALYCHSG